MTFSEAMAARVVQLERELSAVKRRERDQRARAELWMTRAKAHRWTCSACSRDFGHVLSATPIETEAA